MSKKFSLDDINLNDYNIDREEIEKKKKKKGFSLVGKLFFFEYI